MASVIMVMGPVTAACLPDSSATVAGFIVTPVPASAYCLKEHSQVLHQVAARCHTQNFKETSTEKTQSLAGEGIVRTHTASTGMIRGPQLGMMFACIPVSWLLEFQIDIQNAILVVN